ncbi:cyclophilin-like domain-containing protein [Lipomyces arxii]|uniref:cyclophilin-like domain-containing protein n=1 Tax=Lipomyces arxii TaxID=56418 RepID=UPI0034CF7510
MGKNTDKLYITQSEWSGPDKYGGSGGAYTRKSIGIRDRKLPFTYCSLSLQPFESAVCDVHGNIFDRAHIEKWIEKRGKNPVTDEKMTKEDLISLNFVKNEDGKYVDPVSFKVFTPSSRIVAIKKSGNVFLGDTIDRLNVASKNWTDLVNGEEFSRSDLVTLQDPMQVVNESAKIKRVSQGVKRGAPEGGDSGGGKKVDVKAGVSSNGRAAISLTSTAATPYTKIDREVLTDEEYLLKPRRVKQPGEVLMRTNVGNMGVELYTEYAPRAVYNFLKLAETGYYNGVKFHRNIKKFMIQGGDPTGTGRGGESFWKKPFKDEFDGPLSHDSRGLLSMANKGKNTNTSQFFISYKPNSYLDKKHTIFGKVTTGLDVLDRMEAVPSDSNDVPLKTLVINDILVVTDPFKEYMSKQTESSTATTSNDMDNKMTWSGKVLDPTGRNSGSSKPVVKRVVGKYLASTG